MCKVKEFVTFIHIPGIYEKLSKDVIKLCGCLVL